MILTEKEVLQILMTWRHRVEAAAWVVVRDSHASEDIFQNVALKALTRDVSFESESAVLSWAFITARREGIDWLRRRRRETPEIGVELIDLMCLEWLTRDPGGARVEALRECLERVPEESRQLLRWRYFEGRPCQEVARMVGVKLDALYKRLSRLHESLRDCVESRLPPLPREEQA